MPQNKNPKPKTAAGSSTANQKQNSPTAKPGFKLTKLGWIPLEWEVVRMNRIATLVNGRAYKQEELLDEGKYKVLRVGNVFSNRSWYYSDMELPDDKYVEDGDLMYAWSASFGPMFWKGEKTIYHYHIWKVLENEDVSRDFLFSLLDFDVSRLMRAKQGGTMAHITKGAMEKRQFLLPSLKEQTKIATCLTTWDRAITTTRNLLQQLDERKKGLMQGLLTGAVRVPGFIGEWEETRIGSLILESKIIGEGNKVDRRIKVRLDLNGVLARDVKGNESIDSTIYYRRSEGQFIYGKQNLHKGAMGLIPSYLDGFESTSDVPAFDFKRGVDPDWFLFYMARPNFYKWLEVISTGTGSKRIQPKVLFKVKINLPTLPEQKAIAKILTTADQEIALYKRKLAKLEAQKKGLMQQLLTGQKRLQA
jgi:type I restriction enzyme S subunit